MRNSDGLTETEARIVHVLLDGQWHRQRELLRAIDEQASIANLRTHLTNIRKSLESKKETITTQIHPIEGTLYQLCRALSPMING